MQRIGAIIRSVGERTEGLCRKSLERGIGKENVVVIRNVSPFLDTLRKCYEAALKHKFDWYLLVDADMVMTKNWKESFMQTLGDMENKGRLWEFTFKLKDGIERRNIDAIHVVKGSYSKELLKSVDNVTDGLKPEGKVRDDMIRRTGAKRIITKNVIAYHGYEQYLRDVFNRFYNRACRDPKYIDKFGIFKNIDTEDQKVAYAGWSYGIRKKDLRSLDFRNKVYDVSQFGFKERSHIRYGLETFYKRVR